MRAVKNPSALNNRTYNNSNSSTHLKLKEFFFFEIYFTGQLRGIEYVFRRILNE